MTKDMHMIKVLQIQPNYDISNDYIFEDTEFGRTGIDYRVFNILDNHEIRLRIIRSQAIDDRRYVRKQVKLLKIICVLLLIVSIIQQIVIFMILFGD
jgi:hypothetical protein